MGGGGKFKEKTGRRAVYEEKDFQSEKRGDASRNISSNRICIRAARTRSPLPGASTSRIQRNLKLRRFHVVRQKGALQMAKVDAKGDADRTDTKGKLDIQRENNAESRIFGKLSS